MTVPTGISAGAAAVLQIVSDMRRIMAPHNMDAGKCTRAFDPASFLAQCGAMSPIKPIVPPAQTAAEAASVPARSVCVLSFCTSSPRDAAVVSPA